jgi:hypothetical protein
MKIILPAIAAARALGCANAGLRRVGWKEKEARLVKLLLRHIIFKSGRSSRESSVFQQYDINK